MNNPRNSPWDISTYNNQDLMSGWTYLFNIFMRRYANGRHSCDLSHVGGVAWRGAAWRGVAEHLRRDIISNAC